MLEDSLSARELHEYILPPDTRKFSICPDQSEHTTKELTFENVLLALVLVNTKILFSDYTDLTKSE